MTREALTALARDAAEASGAVQVILFGSSARGDVRENSDVDLLLVLPDETQLTKAMTQAQRALFPRPISLDLVPMHLSHWRKGASVLARTVAKEGIVLYE
jgi:predicted nucleotidyltransferase